MIAAVIQTGVERHWAVSRSLCDGIDVQGAFDVVGLRPRPYAIPSPIRFRLGVDPVRKSIRPW